MDETSEAARATTTSNADASETARASRVPEPLFSDDKFKTSASLGVARISRRRLRLFLPSGGTASVAYRSVFLIVT